MINGLNRIAVVLSMVFIFTMTISSNGQKEIVSDNSGTTENPIILTMLIDNQTSLDGINSVITAAEEKLKIRVEIELRPGGSEGDNLLKTRLVASEMTDLSFYNSGSLFIALKPQQNFIDLTDEPMMDSVMDSFKSTVMVKNRVYAIPAATAMAGGWFYNKKVYSELGLKIPRTWDELMNNCEIIEEAGTQSVIATYKDSWTAQLLILADYYNIYSSYPDFAADYTAHKTGFADNPAAVRGFEKLSEIYERGFIGNEPLATGYEDGLNMLLNGEGAHYPMLAFILPILKTLDSEKVMDIGFFPQPGDSPDKNGLTLWMPGGISIYSGSKNIEAAKKWIEFYISPEGIKAYMDGQAPEGPFVIKGIDLPENVFTAVKDILPYINRGESVAALEYLSPIKGPSLPQISVQAGMNIETALKSAQDYDRDVEKQAKQLGIAGW